MSLDRSGAIAAAMITSAIAPTTMTPTMIQGRWRRSVVRMASTSLLHPQRPTGHSPRMRQNCRSANDRVPEVPLAHACALRQAETAALDGGSRNAR